MSILYFFCFVYEAPAERYLFLTIFLINDQKFVINARYEFSFKSTVFVRAVSYIIFRLLAAIISFNLVLVF